MKGKLEIHEYTKVLLPAKGYNVSEDKRLLIPFTSGTHIGFMNHDMEVVVAPKYIMYYGDCYSEGDYIKVAAEYNYGYPRANNNVAAYSRPVYGLINYLGKIVIEPIYLNMIVSKCCNEMLLTIQRKNREYGVINLEGEEIVPFGKYDLIEGFDRGLARVKIGKRSSGYVNNGNKWGVINEKGEEIIPCIYDKVWPIYGKGYNYIVVEDGLSRRRIPFTSLVGDNNYSYRISPSNNTCEEEQTYNEYNGSYAQDVMGYSDQTINDAFEGDSDAYWNID